MRFFSRGMSCFRRRKRKSNCFEYSEEELDEQGMRDLEATLAEHSTFVVLRGDKLRRVEERLERLAELFRRSATLPPAKIPAPLEGSRRRQVHALMQTSSAHPHLAGPSHSLDSAHESSLFSPDLASVVDGVERQPVVMPARVGIAADSPMFAKDQKKIPELESEMSDDRIPAALMSGSGRGDSVIPDTATTGDTKLTDMNDWNIFRPLTSFTDINVPDTRRVCSFNYLESQCIVASSLDDIERSRQPRAPERDLNSTDGLLFSTDILEVLHTARESTTARSSSPEIDPDAAERVISRLRENRRQRKFRASRVSISPNFPVNVWDDVAPTRLHAHLINISMDQDHNMLPVMP